MTNSTDINIQVSEEEFAFLRWQSVKLNTSVQSYIKRLIADDQKHKKAESSSLYQNKF